MQSRIFLAVSGCKRGFSVFHISPGLDLSYPGVGDSLCDMRKYLRVAMPGVDYYGLDFIKGFRVCSIYRSTLDAAGSSGGFVSIALFIPDGFSCRNTRQVLLHLLETYYERHFNRQVGIPVAGVNEDFSGVEGLLSSFSNYFAKEPLHYLASVSNFQADPIYLSGPTPEAIDTVFASPYQKAYLSGSKLIMLPDNVMRNPGAYSVVFNTPVRTVTAKPGISDRLMGNLLPLNQKDCAISRFILNGIDYTSTYTSVCLSPLDTIDFDVILPNGKSASIKGTVEQSLKRKVLVPSGYSYAFNFFPYDVAVQVTGLNRALPRENVLIPSVVTPREVMPIVINARGEGYFKVKAPLNSAALALTGKDGRRVVVEQGFITPSTDFRAPKTLEMKCLTLHLPASKKGQCTLSIGNVPFTIDSSPHPLAVIIPAGLYQPMMLRMQKKEWMVNPANGICTQMANSKTTIPMWAWIAAGAVAVVVALGFIFFMPDKGKEKNNTPADSGVSFDLNNLIPSKNDTLTGTGFEQVFEKGGTDLNTNEVSPTGNGNDNSKQAGGGQSNGNRGNGNRGNGNQGNGNQGNGNQGNGNQGNGNQGNGNQGNSDQGNGDQGNGNQGNGNQGNGNQGNGNQGNGNQGNGNQGNGDQGNGNQGNGNQGNGNQDSLKKLSRNPQVKSSGKTYDRSRGKGKSISKNYFIY